MKLWRLASKKEIDNMTFEEAVEIVMTQVELGHRTGDFRPREHMTKALEIVLAKAEGTKAHWTDDGYCSVCGAPIPTDSRLDYISENDCHYCYDCGSKMNEKMEEN